MPDSMLAPVLTGVRVGLHVFLVALSGVTVAGAVLDASPVAGVVAVVAGVLVCVYLVGVGALRRAGIGVMAGAGGPTARPVRRRLGPLAWLVAVTCLWITLTCLQPEGAYLVFPLAFLYLDFLPAAGAVAAIAIATVFSILVPGERFGYSIGSVIGPLVATGMALVIGVANRALIQGIRDRERLLHELRGTRRQLADAERERGVVQERARLAREIHDTVAQSLASIQMLLSAAERDTSAADECLRLARESAADALADTRQIIRELTPTRLDAGLSAALRRLGAEQGERTGLPVDVVAEELALPMSLQTALLRIAQGALANAVAHSGASRVSVRLERGEEGASSVVLTVSDDGRGFTPDRDDAELHAAGSFGLAAMRERVSQLDGTLEVVSAPGDGTTVTATLPVRERKEGSA